MYTKQSPYEWIVNGVVNANHYVKFVMFSSKNSRALVASDCSDVSGKSNFSRRIIILFLSVWNCFVFIFYLLNNLIAYNDGQKRRK